jgi:2-oxoglutarate dehydrogenase E2 component (dihydrolipoamide succinyltransferase)
MIVDVILPQLGESVSEGTITKILVRVGDMVTKDQDLFEVATDKADAPVPSPATGRITEIHAAQDQTIAVKTIIARIDTEAKGDAPVAAAPAAAAPAAEVVIPEASKSATGEPLASPTVRKAALEADVKLEGVKGTGEHGRITKDDVARAAGAVHPMSNMPPANMAFAAPPAVKAAQPSSAAAEVAKLVNQGGGFVPPVPGVGFGSFKVAPYKPTAGDKVVPYTRRRRITADHMTYSKQVSPHVVTVAEIDLHAVSKLREAHKDRYKKEGLSLTMLAFVVSATARALREFPDLNARVLDDSYVQFKDVNIGVAVDSPDGLVVPVVRRADELGVRGIVRTIDELAKRAKGGKVTIDDLSGATFSVTNPGLKGNLFGGAIISQPNVGILRMGETKKRVVVVEGPSGEDVMAIHPVMYMALSYDHRIVDGVAANGFLWRVNELLTKGEFDVG